MQPTIQIPVYRGCSKPLLARKQHAGDYHGKDGLGDVPDPDALGLDLLLDGFVKPVWGSGMALLSKCIYQTHIL